MLDRDPFAFADPLGPARVIHVHEPSVGLKGTLVVDNVAAGPAIGGRDLQAASFLERSQADLAALEPRHDHHSGFTIP